MIARSAAPPRARRLARGCALLLACSNGAAATDAAATCAVDLPSGVEQGALVLGRATPGCVLEHAGRRLRLAADGTFVFGVGRDAPASVELTARPAQGPARTLQLAVTPRQWPTEHVDGVPPQTVEPPPELAARIAREQGLVRQARERDDDRQDFRHGFIWPARGRVSGVYGSQRVLNGVPKDPHYGLDIAAPEGAPVSAPAGGVVTLAELDFFLTGGTVLLDHGHGLSSAFVHLSRIDVAVGQRVEQGDAIGAVGMTGRATGPHLHWGMNWHHVRIDPQPLLSNVGVAR